MEDGNAQAPTQATEVRPERLTWCDTPVEHRETEATPRPLAPPPPPGPPPALEAAQTPVVVAEAEPAAAADPAPSHSEFMRTRLKAQTEAYAKLRGDILRGKGSSASVSVTDPAHVTAWIHTYLLYVWSLVNITSDQRMITWFYGFVNTVRDSGRQPLYGTSQ